MALVSLLVTEGLITREASTKMFRGQKSNNSVPYLLNLDFKECWNQKSKIFYKNIIFFNFRASTSQTPSIFKFLPSWASEKYFFIPPPPSYLPDKMLDFKCNGCQKAYPHCHLLTTSCTRRASLLYTWRLREVNFDQGIRFSVWASRYKLTEYRPALHRRSLNIPAFRFVQVQREP
jgi:hypothetical protein